MPTNDLRPFLSRHFPPHTPLTAKTVNNFRQKAIKYLAVYGNKEVTEQEASQLLGNSTTEETIATDSSIKRKEVEKLLSNVMTRGDIWTVVDFFDKMKEA